MQEFRYVSIFLHILCMFSVLCHLQEAGRFLGPVVFPCNRFPEGQLLRVLSRTC
jgi:hypothetical protein